MQPLRGGQRQGSIHLGARPGLERNLKGGRNHRLAALPGGQTDPDPTDLGDWESSEVLDVVICLTLGRGPSSSPMYRPAAFATARLAAPRNSSKAGNCCCLGRLTLFNS